MFYRCSRSRAREEQEEEEEEEEEEEKQEEEEEKTTDVIRVSSEPLNAAPYFIRATS